MTSLTRVDDPAVQEDAAAAASRDVNTAAWREELEDEAAAASKVWIHEFMQERDDWMDDSADMMASFAGAAGLPRPGSFGRRAAAGVGVSAGLHEQCLCFTEASEERRKEADQQVEVLTQCTQE